MVEEDIKNELIQKFNYLDNKIRIQRARRIWVDVTQDKFFEVFDHLVKNMKFNILCTITGFDDTTHYSAMYHLAQDSGITLHLKYGISKENPTIHTITATFPGGELYERELVDLFGIKVEGLPEGKRYPLPDNWPAGQYPLRKDWKKESLKEVK